MKRHYYSENTENNKIKSPCGFEVEIKKAFWPVALVSKIAERVTCKKCLNKINSIPPVNTGAKNK